MKVFRADVLRVDDVGDAVRLSVGADAAARMFPMKKVPPLGSLKMGVTSS